MTKSGTSRDVAAVGARVPFLVRRRVAFGAQAALLLGLPFLRVGGESALRLDVPAGKLHAFGVSLAVDEAFVVLAATLLAIALFLLVTLLFGRLWCGWGCPQTVLGELTRWVEPAPSGSARPWRRAAGFGVTALVSAVVGASLVWWFVPPWEFLSRLAAGTLGPVVGWSWAVCAGVLFLDLAFLRQTFCATVCPYAKLQGVLFDRSTLVVAYDDRRDADCIDCFACVRVCPTRIDIRDGLQVECIACAACVDACAPIMRRLGRAPDLVGYFHGEPGGRRRLLRPGSLALVAATLLSAALLAGAAWNRPLVAVTVSSDPAFAPRRAADGRIVSAYELVLESRAGERLDVDLSIQPDDAACGVAVRPAALSLAPGEIRRLRLVATAHGSSPAGGRGARLTVRARAPGGGSQTRATPIPLNAPEGR